MAANLYKGGSTAYTAMLAGEIDAMFDSMPTPLAHIRSGKIRALADPELKSTLAKWDIEANPGTPEAFGAYIAQESARWREFVGKANLNLQ